MLKEQKSKKKYALLIFILALISCVNTRLLTATRMEKTNSLLNKYADSSSIQYMNSNDRRYLSVSLNLNDKTYPFLKELFKLSAMDSTKFYDQDSIEETARKVADWCRDSLLRQSDRDKVKVKLNTGKKQQTVCLFEVIKISVEPDLSCCVPDKAFFMLTRIY